MAHTAGHLISRAEYDLGNDPLHNTVVGMLVLYRFTRFAGGWSGTTAPPPPPPCSPRPCHLWLLALEQVTLLRVPSAASKHRLTSHVVRIRC
jgi:hypothetical protein